ncbi:M14 family zinc carboxypeptidase [Crocinitomix algicola]|uniref:M14 family zinc carboxypeptidase n=1 Tax=Crocinitomix algicola TaxID=1740263 RepID=UPI00082D5E19|nr:M14 family zinc carboxypeptidase [Crocinitomix algicola]
MKNLLFFVLTLLVGLYSYGQTQYVKVKIYADDLTLNHLVESGVSLDHGKHKSNHFFIADLPRFELSILEDNNVSYEVLIEDVTAHYLAHKNDQYRSHEREVCSGATEEEFNPVTPVNFDLGSMGGYFTYEEFLAELDEMFELYPDLITEKAGILGFETWEGRPIHWVKISDNPMVDEDEHEVLYTAIHHAREPMSLSQTIYYMWYLLENYETNEEVRYLVDETELYFVPMINPDGYRYNQVTNPEGGGMHRKNRNPEIGTGNKGVDLNRNYGLHWNESGTSPYENGDTFAGEGPFSEPETQAIKAFCEARSFKYAFNAHAHGDLLLFPLGWAHEAFAEDHDYFQSYGNHMSLYNQYSAIKSSDLYPASGDSDDWMYLDDLDTKPEIFAFTPEIGDAFWPPVDAILPTCKEMVWTNLILAHMPHIYAASTDLEADVIEETSGYFNFQTHRYGLEDGTITVKITPLEGIASIGEEKAYTLELDENKLDSIQYTLTPEINFGDDIVYILQTGHDLWMRQDTIRKIYLETIPIFEDEASDLSNWTGDWGYTDETYVSPDYCITDSPYDPTYANNLNKVLTLNEVFDFSTIDGAIVQFNARWEIENDYDYVQFMISVDGGSSWQPLCGKYTNLGVSPQDVDQPLYDGTQNDWILEEINLEDFIGHEDVRFQFRLVTDGGLQMDGFYFDDFGVYTGADNILSVHEVLKTEFSLYPNPAQQYLHLKNLQYKGIITYVIHNDVGQIVEEGILKESKLDINHLSNGMYFLTLLSDEKMKTERFTVLK